MGIANPVPSEPRSGPMKTPGAKPASEILSRFVDPPVLADCVGFTASGFMFSVRNLPMGVLNEGGLAYS
jgi:hypothetical protein